MQTVADVDCYTGLGQLWCLGLPTSLPD